MLLCCTLFVQQMKAQVPVTITTAAGGQDAQVWYSQPCSSLSAPQNFGSDPVMTAMAWTWNSIGCGYGETFSYLQFDLSSVPANQVFESATLNLFYPPGYVNQQAGQNDLYVQRVTNNWLEGNITWNTWLAGVPAHTTAGQVSVPAATSSTQNYSIDVSGIVNEWICNGEANHGFRIALQNYATYRSAVFATRDHANPALHPQLVMQFATLTASAAKTTICTGESVQLGAAINGQNGYTFQWTSLPGGFSSTQQNPIVTPSQTTQYIVTATGPNGCSMTDTVTVTVTNCCVPSGQPYTKFHSSFVDQFHMHPMMEIEKADLKSNGNLLMHLSIEQPLISGGIHLDGFLVEVDQNNNYLWSRINGGSTSMDHALCVEETSKGDYIASGVTNSMGAGTSNAYLEKTDAAGTVLWNYVYSQSRHWLNEVVITEINSGEYIIAGMGTEIMTNQNVLVVIHTDPNGNLLSYMDYGVTNRNIGIIRDVRPTSDDGFIIAGSVSGDIGIQDYVSALLVKFDAGASVQWWKMYRVNTPSGVYLLQSGNPDERTEAVANAVMEDVANNKYVAVGYANDYGLVGSGTYWDGFIFEVDPNNGTLLNQRLGNNTVNDIVSYGDINMSSSQEYLVSGYIRNNAGFEQSLYIRYDNALNVINNNFMTYDNAGNQPYNRAHSIFEIPGTTDIYMFGYDMMYFNRFNPYVMRIDQNGNGNCPNTVHTTVEQTPSVDVPVFPYFMNSSANQVSVGLNSIDYCAQYNQQCNPQLKPGKPASVGSTMNDPAKTVTIYPNPTRNEISVLIKGDDTEPATLTLIDYTGKVVKNLADIIPGKETKVAIDGLTSGIYIAIVQQSGITLSAEKLSVIR